MHVLSLPPAFVLSQDQTLKLKRSDFGFHVFSRHPLKKAPTGSRLNRREHSHLNDQHMSAIKRNCLEKRVRQCLLNRDPSSEEPQGKSRTCRPRFSFFLFNCQRTKPQNMTFTPRSPFQKKPPRRAVQSVAQSRLSRKLKGAALCRQQRRRPRCGAI